MCLRAVFKSIRNVNMHQMEKLTENMLELVVLWFSVLSVTAWAQSISLKKKIGEIILNWCKYNYLNGRDSAPKALKYHYHHIKFTVFVAILDGK